MALRDDFYSTIIEPEKSWIEKINNGLLNSIYCELVLKPFYIQKKKELEEEYFVNNNQILGYFISGINKIINEIDNLYNHYKKTGYSSVESLLPLFLNNQMNNKFQTENDYLDDYEEEYHKAM